MNGTNHSTSGLERATWSDASIRLRLVFFGLSLLMGGLLITWIKTSTWRDVGRLRQEFSSIQADRFALATHLQLTVPRLNDTILDFQLRQDNSKRDRFRSETRKLKQWLKTKRSDLATVSEGAALKKVEAAFDLYLTFTERLLRADEGGPERSFGQIYEDLQEETHPMLVATEGLRQAQTKAFGALLETKDHTFIRLQRMLELSLLLLWVLALFLAVLGYRGMIAPLRNKLSESRAIIQRQEKLASLGVLAAGVAHEIRNPLTAIKFRLFSLNKSLPAVRDNEDAIVINGEINRLDQIVKDFLQFARPSEPKLVCLPAERLLQQASDLLHAQLEKNGIALKSHLSETTWVHADHHQIEQVLINLIQNAADSIGHNGTISLRVREGTALLGGRIKAAVILEVADTGKGIAPEVEKRLFDPFFTTKEGGTGLGLAIAARIIEKHGGILRHHTKLNQGTTFEVVLPKLDHDAT